MTEHQTSASPPSPAPLARSRRSATSNARRAKAPSRFALSVARTTVTVPLSRTGKANPTISATASALSH
jgi:hypothetical protein